MDGTDLRLPLPALALCAALHWGCCGVLLYWRPHPHPPAAAAFGALGLGCSLMVLLPGLWGAYRRRAAARRGPARGWGGEGPLQRKPSAAAGASTLTINDLSVRERFYRCRSVSFMDNTRVERMISSALDDAVQEDGGGPRDPPASPPYPQTPEPLSPQRPERPSDGAWALSAAAAFAATDLLWAACGLHSLWLLTALPPVATRHWLLCAAAPLPSVVCVVMRAFALSLLPRALSPVEVVVFQGGNVVLPILVLLWQVHGRCPDTRESRGWWSQ